MKIFIATDVNVTISRGRIFANQKHSTILRRYFDSFGSLILCARFIMADTTTESYEDITDIVDSVVEMQSLYRMFLNKYQSKIEIAMKDCDLVICRCPSIAAYKAADVARKLNIPYLTESMGDPWDAYWNHGLQGKIIAPYMFFKMKNVVRSANYAVYVTNRFLQHRYPSNCKSISASNVLIREVNENVFKERKQRLMAFDKHKITLMTTAAVDVRYKGQEYVIRAIPKLNKRGIRIKYLIVGEGDNSFLKSIAISEKVESQVEFLGKLPLDDVLSLLDIVDIYIQPSLQEGLPRSVIEAMSRGCPCIGARTAGIPELLEDSMIVKRKSVEDIVCKIFDYIKLAPEEKIRMSRRNYDEAKQYTVDVLDDRRNKYFESIKSDIKKCNQYI